MTRLYGLAFALLAYLLPVAQATAQCRNPAQNAAWNDISRNADPELMARIIGTWENKYTVDTYGVKIRTTYRPTYEAGGTMIFDSIQCTRNPVNGRNECYNNPGHGLWAARMHDGQWFILAAMVSSATYRNDCGASILRFKDKNTIVSQSGASMVRVKRKKSLTTD